jgi:pheromone shutdown protein TraB
MNVVLYWLARLGLFALVVAALAVVGWFDVISVIASFVVAWLLSYIALGTMRAKAAVQMDGWLATSRERRHVDDAVEDAELDAEAEPGTP